MSEQVEDVRPVRQADGVRVSDAERERVARRLADAHGEGRLTLAEFDERVRAAHGAVVRADLAPLLADLPTAPAPGSPAPERRHHRPLPHPVPFGGPCGAMGLRAATTAWAVAGVVNVVIWLAVVAGTGHLVHPWWIWVVGPWGLVLLARLGARRTLAG